MDQLYIEEGYIDASYYGIVAEAQANLGGAFTPSFTVDIADPSGYYIPDYIEADYFKAPGEVVEAYGTFETVASTTAVGGIVYEMAADFEAFAGSTLVADALKNHTALFDAVITMDATASKVAGNTITLESIINQSLQSDRVRFVSFDESAAFAAQTAPSVLRDFGALLSSSGGFGLTLTTNADVAITTTASMTVSPISYTPKTLVAPRPIDWATYLWNGSNFNTVTTSPSYSAFDTTVKKYGSASIKVLPSDISAVSTSDLNTDPIGYTEFAEANQDFVVEFWYYKDSSAVQFNSLDDVFIMIGGRDPTPHTFSSTTGIVQIGERFTSGRYFVKYVNINNAITTMETTVSVIDNAWTHLAIRRVDGVVRFEVNGILRASNTDSSRFNYFKASTVNTASVSLHNTYTSGNVYYDAVTYRRGDATVTGRTSEPQNSDTTVFLQMFDGDYNDFAGNQSLDAQASLTASSSLTAVPNRTLGAITIQQSSGTLTAHAVVVKSVSAAVSSQSSLTAITGFVKTVDTTFESIATDLTAASKIADFFVNADVVATATINVNEIVQLQSDIVAQSTAGASAVKTTDTTANIQSTAAIDANASGGFIGLTPTTLASQATILADVARQRNTASSIDAQTTTSINVVRTTDIESTSLSNFAIVIDNQRTRDTSTVFDSIATELAVVAKIGDFLVNADVVAQLTADATKSTGNIVVVEANATVDATASVIRSAAADVGASASTSIDVVAGIAAEASLESNSTLTATARSTLTASATIASAGGFAISVQATRNDEVEAIATSSLVAKVGLIKQAATAATSTATVVANGGKTLSVNTSVAVNSTLVATGGLVHIQEIVYIIPRETRVFTINSEDRAYTIFGENRNYTIGA